MRFVVAMAWREVRASWRRLILFFLCIALGVGATVSLRSFSRVLSGSLARDSRMLLSADVRVESPEPWSAEQIEILSRHAASPRVTGHTRMLETQTVVRAADSIPPGAAEAEARPVMVELKGLEPGFPLRGEFRLANRLKYSHDLLAGGGVLVSASLLDRLHVAVGDRIVIGGAPFTIRGAIERMPGNALNFSPMPRVAADYDAVQAAGLTAFGSRVRYNWLFTVPDGEERDFAQAIGREYGDRRIRGAIGSFHWVENWLTSGLSNIDGFLSLIGLAIIVLGGIGIASVTRVFVQQRIRTVAILKSLGGRNRRVIGAYLAQVFALSLAGSLLGLLVAQGITSGLSGFASARLPLDVEPRLSAVACAQGVVQGVLVALLFALPPLLEIRDVKPILVLRSDVAAGRRRVDWLRLAAQLLLGAAVAGLAGWQAGTYRNAALFVGGIAATAIVLNAASATLVRLLAGLRRLPWFVLRQGVGSLYRPGNQTRVTLFTVGLGALFVIAVRLFQVNVQQEYALDLSGLSADMFMIDVQPQQRVAVAAALETLGARSVTLLPMSRVRLVGLKRDPLNPNRVPANQVGGEYRVTHRLTLDTNETIVKGQFWPPSPSPRAEISVESGYAEWMRLRIGDVMVFEIAGRRIDAWVTNLRKEDRRVRTLSSLARSDIVFRPGALESLPHTFVGGAKGPDSGAARARLQNEFLKQFPGITLADALDDIEEVRRRVRDVSSAVDVLGGFVLLCGVLILVGAVAMTKMQRLYEAAVLKTLGAKRRVLVRITVVEYAVLGLLAGIIGSGASIAVTWGMSRYGNRPLPWQLHPWINLIGAVLTAIVVILVGVLATWDVAARKPLGILRDT
jgi:putative ABC transport system permease protein